MEFWVLLSTKKKNEFKIVYLLVYLRSLNSVGTRPGIMYWVCKVHKGIIDSCLLFRLILSAINTSTYKLVKFLVPILKSSNEYTV